MPTVGAETPLPGRAERQSGARGALLYPAWAQGYPRNSAAVQRWPVRPAAIAVFFVLWLPFDIHWLNLQRDVTLRQDGDAREWITTLGRFAQTGPLAGGFVYSGLPEGFHTWGMEGAVKYFYRVLDVTIPVIDSPEAGERLRSGRARILTWDGTRHRLEIQTP